MVSKIFFSSNLVGRIFFTAVQDYLLPLCCMQFFSSDKRLQEIFFFKITHSLPQELNLVKETFLNRLICYRYP